MTVELSEERVPRPTVVFDGDDTLWGTQELYDEAKERFVALLQGCGHDPVAVARKLAEIDVRNVARFGLSQKRFPTSMRETYEFFCGVAGAAIRSDVADQAVDIGQAVFAAKPVVRPDAEHVLDTLRPLYRLVLFTAGDDIVQRRRIEQSGLAAYFDVIRVAPRKTVLAWRALLDDVIADSSSAWTLGNSIKSDINPALELGLRGVVVAGRTWLYEQEVLLDLGERDRVWYASTLSEAADIVIALDQPSKMRWDSGVEGTR